ncbi:hypothetical protein PR002_g26039 [Phytophthora rubi]|uniref:RxLR effector protein n=1 Tax=Phytophthora rubi TaxID=129364 RepID=A0A6A3HVF1_9STRA|nr:hypothetical protein PR002_g26039 [Phytophthora rubi]
MKRYFVVLVCVTLLAQASEALSTITDSNQAEPFGRQNDRPKRLLRVVEHTDEANDPEERGFFDKLTKVADKWHARSTTSKQQHKNWIREGDTPQTLFRIYNWEGKSIEELKLDPNYQRYEGFDDLWLLKQNKKGNILTPEQWAKLMKKQEKN